MLCTVKSSLPSSLQCTSEQMTVSMFDHAELLQDCNKVHTDHLSLVL